MMKITITHDFEVADAQQAKELQEAMKVITGFGTKGIINLNKELKNNFIAKSMVDKIVKKK